MTSPQTIPKGPTTALAVSPQRSPRSSRISVGIDIGDCSVNKAPTSRRKPKLRKRAKKTAVSFERNHFFYFFGERLIVADMIEKMTTTVHVGASCISYMRKVILRKSKVGAPPSSLQRTCASDFICQESISIHFHSELKTPSQRFGRDATWKPLSTHKPPNYTPLNPLEELKTLWILGFAGLQAA